MARRLEFTLRLFEQESRDNPRILAIGLHPHLIAVPHRFQELVRMIDLLQASDTVGFTTGSALCDWFTSVQPAEH